MKQNRAPAIVAVMLWCISASLAFQIGCASSQPYVIHAGSIAIANDGGAFDSHTADFLSEEHAFLESFKGKTEPAPVQTAINAAQEQYAITKASYLTWRTAQTAQALADLNMSKAQLTAAVGNVSAAQKASGQ